MKKLLFSIILTCCSFLIACSTAVNKPSVEPVDSIDSSKSRTKIDEPGDINSPTYEMKPVVVSLLKKAGQRMDAEDYDSAANFIERGISISPNNPVLWQQLATVRLRQGDFFQAEQLAVKSNVLGESDNLLRLKNWKIIAEAKKMQKSQASP